MRKTNKADRTSVKAVDTLRPRAGVRTTAVDCYRSGVSAPVYPAAGRRCACPPAHILAEVAVAGEANGDRDLGDRLVGAEPQFLCPADAPIDPVEQRRFAGGSMEGHSEILRD